MSRKYLLSILMSTMMILSSLYVWLEYNRFLTTPLLLSEASISYTVKNGDNLTSISRDLKQQQLTELPPFYFSLYGRIQGRAHLIKAGEYQLKSGTTLPQFFEQLIVGKVIQHAITLIEGMTIAQALKVIHAHPKIKHTLTEPTIATLMTQLGKPALLQPEGLFYPDTYYFPTGITDIEFLKRAHEKMTVTLQQAWQDKAANLPYANEYEALIMASIIEKETGIAEERAEIAGVFVRRLQKGMRLQTDPTVIYGLGEAFDGNLRRRDLKRDTPYNTYANFGLPPTPISLVSNDSLIAALHPKQGTSLYFVATGQNGRHVFSSNLQDHNKAVRRYQLNRK